MSKGKPALPLSATRNALLARPMFMHRIGVVLRESEVFRFGRKPSSISARGTASLLI